MTVTAAKAEVRAALAAGAAAVGVLILAALLRTPHFDPANTIPNPARAVKLQLVAPRGQVFQTGTAVHAPTAFGISFENPRYEPTQLILYALDSTAAIHWLIPGMQPNGHPEPVGKGVSHTEGARGLLTSGAIGPLPAGPLTVIALVNPGPIRVDRLESLAPDWRTPDGLRQQFPDGVVATWSVEILP